LNSLETRKLETHSLIVFQLQLTVKSGHGLSDGPTGPLVPKSAKPQENASSQTANLIQEPLR
jgi:hypothetical protein